MNINTGLRKQQLTSFDYQNQQTKSQNRLDLYIPITNH